MQIYINNNIYLLMLYNMLNLFLKIKGAQRMYVNTDITH